MYPTKANPSPVRLFNVEDYLDKLERESRPFAEVMCDTQVGGDEKKKKTTTKQTKQA